MVVLGLNNNDITGRLFRNRSTVRFHVCSILSMLVAASLIEAAALTLQNNLVM